jgi:hypothetical protein
MKQLDSLFVEFVKIINEVGGAHSCTMKLEHVPRYYVSEGVELLKPDSDISKHGVPPVIDEIKYKNQTSINIRQSHNIQFDYISSS